MTTTPQQYSTLVEYCFRNGGDNHYYTLNSQRVITNGMLYAPYCTPNSPVPIYTVSAQRIIDALPADFCKKAQYSMCMAAVKTTELPYYFPTISTYFREYQQRHTVYVIVLSEQTAL
jgi:hypothetical protein